MGISDDGVRLTLRLPENLRNRLGKLARRNVRSINSEIVSILDAAVKSELSANRVREKKKSYGDPNEELERRCKELSKEQASVVLDLLRMMD